MRINDGQNGARICLPELPCQVPSRTPHSGPSSLLYGRWCLAFKHSPYLVYTGLASIAIDGLDCSGFGWVMESTTIPAAMAHSV